MTLHQRTATYPTLAEAVEAAHEEWSRVIQRAEQAEADAVAMRNSVENFALSFTGFNFNCTICGAHGKAKPDLKHDGLCALSSTAGRDLLARMERMKAAVETVIGKFKQDQAQGYRSKDRTYAIEVLGAALADQPGEKG